MSVVFVICVKHPENSINYSNVWSQLRYTLYSVCAQNNKNFRVIVVSNKTLDDFSDDSKIINTEFIEVNFPPPLDMKKWDAISGMGNVFHEPEKIEPIRQDKGTKYIIGIIAAQKYAPKYIMPMDADDYISCNIVSFAEDSGHADGYFINNGFALSNGHIRHIYKNYNKFNGTCNIIGNHLLLDKIPINSLTVSSSQNDILHNVDGIFLTMILGAHPFTVKYYIARSIWLIPIPFPGAVYNLSPSERHRSNLDKLRGFPAGDVIEFSQNFQDYVIKEFTIDNFN